MTPTTPREVTLNDWQRECLTTLFEMSKPDGEMCLSFNAIGGEANWKKTRVAVRALARKGLAEYYRGLTNDDGDMCGSGYCITHAGIELAKLLNCNMPTPREEEKCKTCKGSKIVSSMVPHAEQMATSDMVPVINRTCPDCAPVPQKPISLIDAWGLENRQRSSEEIRIINACIDELKENVKEKIAEPSVHVLTVYRDNDIHVKAVPQKPREGESWEKALKIRIGKVANYNDGLPSSFDDAMAEAVDFVIRAIAQARSEERKRCLEAVEKYRNKKQFGAASLSNQTAMDRAAKTREAYSDEIIEVINSLAQ
jgi:hypothetical protein